MGEVRRGPQARKEVYFLDRPAAAAFGAVPLSLPLVPPPATVVEGKGWDSFDDGYVSDGEGPMSLAHISPADFARWAVGCAQSERPGRAHLSRVGVVESGTLEVCCFSFIVFRQVVCSLKPLQTSGLPSSTQTWWSLNLHASRRWASSSVEVRGVCQTGMLDRHAGQLVCRTGMLDNGLGRFLSSTIIQSGVVADLFYHVPFWAMWDDDARAEGQDPCQLCGRWLRSL